MPIIYLGLLVHTKTDWILRFLSNYNWMYPCNRFHLFLIIPIPNFSKRSNSSITITLIEFPLLLKMPRSSVSFHTRFSFPIHSDTSLYSSVRTDFDYIWWILGKSCKFIQLLAPIMGMSDCLLMKNDRYFSILFNWHNNWHYPSTSINWNFINCVWIMHNIQFGHNNSILSDLTLSWCIFRKSAKS